MPRPVGNEVNKEHGKLLVFARGTNNGKHIRWWCMCLCGETALVRGDNLRSGHTTSCGCIKVPPGGRPAQYKYPSHGKYERLYYQWRDMLARCYNEKNAYYYRYGGRNISVCQAWHDWDTYCEWAISHNYTDDLTIDRIDVNGSYCPDNVEYVTASENSKRRHHSPKNGS